MKLKAHTTYVNNKGTRVEIMGLARVEPVDGLPIWWSLQGNHYAEDGRMVHHVRVVRSVSDGDAWERRLLDASAGDSLKEEAR